MMMVRTPHPHLIVVLAGCWLLTVAPPVGATSLTGTTPPTGGAPDTPKDTTVKKYLADCRTKGSADAACDKMRKEAMEILKEDVLTLGSSANRDFLPTLLPVFKSEEPELRVAVLDAIGMMGATDADAPMLAKMANDPVPDVRRAASQTISRGKGSGISLLGQRIVAMKSGLTPDAPPDPGKYAFTVAPDSTYLYYGSDQAGGRLSYVSKSEPGAFFKAKAKKGPLKLSEFQDKYRYHLQDEEEARQQVQDAQSKQLEQMKPDPTNSKALAEFLERAQSVQMGQMSKMLLDTYQPALFKDPTVYVLEERQIGQRSYPTRYVVLYQDLALKRPGYRLSWMTVPDDAIKAVQIASLVAEKEEEGRKKEVEALKKRTEALQNLEKKKDEQEKKKFKKGQADLEKELGF